MSGSKQSKKTCPAPGWSAWLDSLIPEEFLSEPDLRLRSRVLANILTVGTALAILIELLIVVVSLFVESSLFSFAHLGTAVMLLVYGLSYKILRDYKSITIAANLVLAALFVNSGIYYIFFHMDHNPPMVLWVTISALAFIMGGKPVGYAWLCVILVTSVIAMIIDPRVISEVVGPRDGERFPYSNLVLIVASLTLLGAACGIYETVATQFRRQLDFERNHFRHLSEHDPLTGLLNRRALEATLESISQGVISNVKQCALVYIDLNDFKAVNDRLGHSVGDSVLVEVANRIRHTIRDSDFAARIGGDEFIIGMLGARSPDNAMRKADELLEALSRPMSLGHMRLTVGASAGLAMFPKDADNILDIISLADQSMYQAKASTTRIVAVHKGAASTC